MKNLTLDQAYAYLKTKLLEGQTCDTLLDFAEDAQQALYAKWSDDSAQSKIAVYLQKLYSQLDFTLQPLLKENQEFQSILRLGSLLGSIETFQWFLYQQQQTQWAMTRIEKEAETVKHLPQVVQALESHGSMYHSELSQYLGLKESTLTEAMKKILETEIVYSYPSGKYKIYSLSDTGIRYGREMRKRHSGYQSVEQAMDFIFQYYSEHQESRVLILKALNDRFSFQNAVLPGDTLDIHYLDKDRLCNQKYFINTITTVNDQPGEVKATGELLSQTEEKDKSSSGTIIDCSILKDVLNQLAQGNTAQEAMENVG